MPLVAIGVSHHHVDFAELAVLTPHAGDLTQALAAHPSVGGVMVLSTCNRFEVYLDAHQFHPVIEAVLALMEQFVGGPSAMSDPQVFVGEGAIDHLLRVTCGLDSMVVGEAEITGQVREAISKGQLNAPLRRLVQHALSTSKQVANQTELRGAGRSVVSVGLDLVESRHGAVAQRRTLIIGTGAYARVVTAELGRREATDLWVYSPSGRAQAFATTHPVQVVSAGALADFLTSTDLVITCSGASEPVITTEALTQARKEATSALPVLDLSLGGDVAPGASALPGVDLIDLEVISQQSVDASGSAVVAANDMVARAVEAYLHLEGERAADPAVIALRAHVMSKIEAELTLVENRYPPEVAELIGRSLRRVSNSLLHAPVLRAHQLARTGGLDDYHRAMSTLFGIEMSSHG